MPARRGLALILVAGVLGILGVLGAAFVTMARLERQASRQRVHETRALLLARAGLEDAMARLGGRQDPEHRDSRYGGEDWRLDGENGPATFDHQQEIYRPGSLDVASCPVRQAVRSSFFARDGFSPPQPDLTPVGMKLRGYTGRLTGDRAPKGHTYAVHVMPQAGFFVNGGDPAQSWNLGYNAVLRTLLGNLAEALDREDGLNNGLPVNQTHGQNLISLRPASGWSSWDQVKQVALGNSQARLDALRPYLTLRAWVDRKVIRPNATAALIGQRYRSWGEIRLARGEPDFERIPVAPAGGIVGRAPVNLAWARTRRPALIALLANLQAVWLNEAQATNQKAPAPNIDLVGVVNGGAPVTLTLNWAAADDPCRAVADRLLACTSDLDTWEAWNAFCEALPDAVLTGTTDERQVKRDLLKAHFNPNSDLNKFNPNGSLWKRVDKTDILQDAYTTEFSLIPLHAHEIASVGRVTDAQGQVLASRELSLELAGASALRLTTQKELACRELGVLEVAGDETGPRLPGQPAYLGRSLGPGRTWGSRLAGLGGRGAGLQTYPEPCVDPGSGLVISPADYDGNLQLATVETGDDETYGQGGASAVRMLGTFTRDFDLDVAASYPGNLLGRQHQPDVLQVTYNGGGSPNLPELSHGLFHPTRPNTLHPDGVYSELGRTPSYFDKGSAHPFHGVMSFWVKPHYVIQNQLTTGQRRMRQWISASNCPEPASAQGIDSVNQVFTLVHGASQYVGGMPGIHCFLEIGRIGGGAQADDPGSEHGYNTLEYPDLNPDPAHRWLLTTLYWNFEAPQSPACVELIQDDGVCVVDPVVKVGSANSYYDGAGQDPALAADLTADALGEPHRIWLGAKRYPYEAALANELCPLGNGADATLDEFVLYDFGAGPPVESVATYNLAINRFREGRYYKGAVYTNLIDAQTLSQNDRAGTFLSPPIRLPGGTRLKGVHWTWYHPKPWTYPTDPIQQVALPDDYAEIELTNASGAQYLWAEEASRSTRGPGWSPQRQDWPVGRVLPDAGCRLHVVFRRHTPLSPDLPILDSPVLDDITLLYEPATGPAVLAWRE